jgi:hypothetical protein
VKRATMGATKGSSASVPTCPVLSYGSVSDCTLAEGQGGTHNAGVGSSSLPPATGQGVVAHWVTRLVAFLRARSATTTATTLYQVVPRDPYADSRIFLIWKWAA